MKLNINFNISHDCRGEQTWAHFNSTSSISSADCRHIGKWGILVQMKAQKVVTRSCMWLCFMLVSHRSLLVAQLFPSSVHTHHTHHFHHNILHRTNGKQTRKKDRKHRWSTTDSRKTLSKARIVFLSQISGLPTLGSLSSACAPKSSPSRSARAFIASI